jgi:flagellar hook protein FlgE
MSVYGLMRTSVSGMAVQADRMGTVSDNIANVSTTGYKKSSTEFSSFIPEATTLQYDSGSVETHVRRLVSEQGTFAYTKSATDLAVNGPGFFVVSGPNVDIALTRAGSFTPDKDGNLVNAAGYTLLGYNMINGNGSVVVNGSAGLEPVNIAGLSLVASPTRSGLLQTILPSTATAVAVAALPSENDATATYSAKTSLVSYDNLGTERTLDIYYSKTADNIWEVSVFDRATASATGGFPYSAGPLATKTIEFDSTNGMLASGSPTSIDIPIPGGATANLKFTGTSQLAADFAVRTASMDGNAPVSVSKVEISNDGILTAIYEKGGRVATYRIPIANVSSPDNMTALSGNVFLPSSASGDILIGSASVSGNGTIASGALEQSTVDLATELTTMIEAQRSYSANSKVFQTGADLMDVIVNLRR